MYNYKIICTHIFCPAAAAAGEKPLGISPFFVQGAGDGGRKKPSKFVQFKNRPGIFQYFVRNDEGFLPDSRRGGEENTGEKWLKFKSFAGLDVYFLWKRKICIWKNRKRAKICVVYFLEIQNIRYKSLTGMDTNAILNSASNQADANFLKVRKNNEKDEESP